MSERKVPKIRFPGFTGEWETGKLEDYLEVSKEKNRDLTFDKEDVLSVSGDYGIVNQIEFQGRSFAGESIANYGVVKNGYVVYTKSPLKSNPYGIIKTNKGKAGIVSTLYAVYKPKENVDASFVQSFFELDSRMNNYMHPLANKGAKNDMKVSDENALKGEVVFPGRKEQIAIRSFFDAIDENIYVCQKERVKWKELKKGMLQKMFPKEGESVPEIRFPGFDDNWRSCQLKELIMEITAGKSVNSDEEKVESEDIGIMKTSCVTDDRFEGDECKRVISEEKGIVKCPVEANTLVISRMNTPDRVGACGYVSENMPNRYLPDRLWKVKFTKDIDTYLAYTLLTTEECKERIKGLASGTSGSMYNISKESFLKLNIVFPVSSEEQNCLSNCFKGLNDMISLNERELGRWQSLKKALLQQMFV